VRAFSWMIRCYFAVFGEMVFGTLAANGSG
jgi:hypothetical protein